MLPVIIPVGILSFLAGAVLLGPGRRGLSMLPKSPLAGVNQDKWRRFVLVMAGHPRNYVSPRRRYGMFGMDMRSLEDVRMVEGAKKVVLGSETGVWAGDWVPPLDEGKFLSSPESQYDAFTKSMQKISPRISKLVGSKIEGIECTLSGLLGVGHHAGERGVEGWVGDGATRRKFKTTTETFNKTNGIF